MRRLILLLFAGLFLFFGNCTKETAGETISVTDTVYVDVIDTTIIPAIISDTTTTLIVLRHAEKEAAGTDPVLNADGILRAEELKRMLNNVFVNAVYSTPYNRTKQTVQPLATAKGLAVTEYPATQPYAELVNNIIAANRGKVAVIVGHSNTVPEILKVLSNNTFNVTIAEDQFDNLFIANLPDSLSPIIMHYKYGKVTP